MPDPSPIQITWDHTLGSVQVRLPSGTRINFTRHAHGFLWAFLNAAHMPEVADHLRLPITEVELRRMKAEWDKSGAVTIKPLARAPANLTLEMLQL